MWFHILQQQQQKTKQNNINIKSSAAFCYNKCINLKFKLQTSWGRKKKKRHHFLNVFFLPFSHFSFLFRFFFFGSKHFLHFLWHKTVFQWQSLLLNMRYILCVIFIFIYMIEHHNDTLASFPVSIWKEVFWDLHIIHEILSYINSNIIICNT